MFDIESIQQLIKEVYPVPTQREYLSDVRRLSLQAELAFLSNGSVADLGSGFSPLALLLHQAGMRAIMLDRFDCPRDLSFGIPTEELRKLLENQGVAAVQCDIQCEALPLPDSSIDVITCLAVLEHFHHSPKPLFAEIWRALKPGGRLILLTPNSVNLRKRIHVFCGKTNLPPVKQFWDAPHWHGHVREPTLSELCWMASNSGFLIQKAFGSNDVGIERYPFAGALLNPLLKKFPTLCSDIYVIASKPAQSH